MSLRISLVIPAYNEERLLPRLLETVETARHVYPRGPRAVEVIVADNGSTDATARIAASFGCRVVTVEKRVIAAVRNGGAAAARGDILCFLDADSQIHPDTFAHVETALDSGRVVAGASGVTLERWSLGLAVTWALMVPLAILLRIDTGVVFCLRRDFDTIGGYNEERLFAEDVQFLLDMRRLGADRGQRLTRLPRVKAVASTRKFDRYGEWHYFTHMFQVAYRGLRNPAAVPDFAREYWYGDTRPATRKPDD